MGDISCIGGAIARNGKVLRELSVGRGLDVSVSSGFEAPVCTFGSLAEYDRVKWLGSPNESMCRSSVSFCWGWLESCCCGGLMHGASSGVGGIRSGLAIVAKYLTTMAAKASKIASAMCVIKAM